MSHHGAKPSVGWDRKAVLQQLSKAYCLEPRFDCWEEQQRNIGSRPAQEIQTKRAVSAARPPCNGNARPCGHVAAVTD